MSRRIAVVLMFLLGGDALGTVAEAEAEAGLQRDAPLHDAGGIWKSAVPREFMHGAFGNHDPVGLMNGQFIKADCSINWTNPDSGRLFCFSTPTSMAYFLYWPRRNTERAKLFWEKSNATN